MDFKGFQKNKEGYLNHLNKSLFYCDFLIDEKNQ